MKAKVSGSFINAIKTVLGVEAPKTELPSSLVLVTKDSEDQWWFFGLYSNRFKDLDQEILSEDSHKEYIQWLKTSGFKPVITAYHLPRAKDPEFWVKVFNVFEGNVPVLQKIVDGFYKSMAFAKVERVVYMNGFTAVLGKFMPGKEHIAENLSKMKGLGMSHGFISKDSSANIFNIYRTFEMSVLRSVRAANPFTLSGALMQKGKTMAGQKASEKALTPEDRKALAELFGEEVINKVEQGTEKAAEVLMRLVDYKDAVEDKAEGEEVVEETENAEEKETPDEKDVETPVLSVEAVAKATRETFEGLQPVIIEMQEKIDAQEKKIAVLEAQLSESAKEVKEIKKSEDQKIAESWLPAFNWRGGYSPAQADDNLVDKKEKEELVVAAPTGERSKVDPENPMNLGFWNILPSLVAPNSNGQ